MGICAMEGGVDLQKYVDLLVPCPSKFKIIQGDGPITLVGSHCVDFSGYRDGGNDESDDEDEATADEEAAEVEAGKGDKKSPAKEEEKQDKKTPVKEREDSGSKKRKASG